MKAQVLGRYVRAHREELIDLTKRLVRIPTINPPGENYEEIVMILERYCKDLGLKTRRIEPPKSVLKKLDIKGSQRISLLAEWNIGAERGVHINCHYDVVPAAGSWGSSAFKPVVKGSKLYGRGSLDMKGSIACVLFALRTIRSTGLKPAYNIQLSFTPDEETGGRTGFGYLVDKGFIKGDFVIGEGYHNNFISYGNKGILWVRIDVSGKSCHACEPYKGINSFEKMLIVANELMKLKKWIEKRKTRFSTKDIRDIHPTMVLGGELYGGKKINVVSDLSSFTIDRRLIPEETVEGAEREIAGLIEKLKKKHKDLKVEIKVLNEDMPAISKKDRIFFKAFSSAVEAVIRKPAKFALLAGGTDPRYIIRKGIPAVGYSVDGDNTCHCDNEYVKIKSLIDTTKIFALFLTKQ